MIVSTLQLIKANGGSNLRRGSHARSTTKGVGKRSLPSSSFFFATSFRRGGGVTLLRLGPEIGPLLGPLLGVEFARSIPTLFSFTSSEVLIQLRTPGGNFEIELLDGRRKARNRTWNEPRPEEDFELSWLRLQIIIGSDAE